MKKILLKSLVLIAIFAFNSCTNDLEDVSIINKPTPSATQLEAVKLGMNLMESFNASPLKSSSDLIYPDYYCGVYLQNGDSLVILIKENSEKTQANLNLRTKGNNYIIREAEYSMNELIKTIDLLNDFILDEGNKSIVSDLGLDGFGIIPSENKLFVDLRNCTEDKITQFENTILNSPMLKFRNSEGVIIAQEGIAPGSGLKATSTGSFGYRGRRSGQVGMVTSGHVARTIGGSVYKNVGVPFPSDLLGSCATSFIGGSVDAAFIVLNSPYTPGNYTSWGTTISSTVEYPFQNATVYKEGNNGFSTGNVTATNITKSITFPSGGSTTLTGLTEATYASAGGDSGCIIYSGSNNIYGIHEGSVGGRVYFILAANINSTLGITTY